MKIAIAVPRFGKDVLGGAEAHGAAYARKLAGLGHQVELVTTCAQDHATWRNHYPEGTEVHDGFTVRRFRTVDQHPAFGETERRIQRRLFVPYELELAWMSSKGHSPGLVEYLSDSSHDCVIFMPYLWAGTYFGVKALGRRAIVHLLLHDEPYARLRVTREIVASAGGLLFNSVPEWNLARRLFGSLPPSELGGMGFEAGEAARGMSAEAFRARHRLGGAPMLLYAGRWEAGKGVPELIEYVRRARIRRPRYRLVLAGGGPDGPKRRTQGVVPLGFLSEWEKFGAFRAADIFCQPSRNESLSIVLMEAWLQRTPVLVSGHCAVTTHHCRVSGGGLDYRSFAEFEAAVEVMLEDTARARRMGEAGRRYVLDVYSWDAVMQRVLGFVERWVR